MAPPPSSSSSSYDASFHPKRYDVFISFRGEDTRSNFTSHLRHAMRQKQIQVYMDDEMNKGDEISLGLLEAIEDSHISVIVFSEDYASSKWCLDELLKILECREEGQDVIPVFYQIDPSNVRKQKGSYEEAFQKHERDFSNNQDKLSKWKQALFEAANLAGWDSRIHRDESTLIQKIVEDVLKKLEYKYPPRKSKCPFGTDENLAPIESLLTEFQTVGIWGMGGIGKTTIAKWLFGKYSSQYEGSCFMENIRENFEKDKQALRNDLVSELLGEYERKINVESVVVKRRLSFKRVFVVLDDVSTSKQLEYLDGVLQYFGSGSRIIITSRNRHVLLWKGVDEIKIHHVKELNPKNSLQLFSLNAFKHNHPLMGYEVLSNKAVAYAKGLPLVLKVVGSFLYSKTKIEWESELEKLQKIPDDEIQSVLQLSYDGLRDQEKDIFLDIACFLKGEREEHVVSLLKDFNPCIGLRNLQDKALITIEHDVVQMHDLIQEMGLEIVRQESIKDPGKRSRLWVAEDIYKVLKYNRGTDKVEGINLDMSQIRDLHFSVDTFRNMTNLRFLKLYLPSGVKDYSLLSLPTCVQLFSIKLRYLEWDRYLSKSLPLMFCTEKLVELSMPDSHLEKLWDGVQDLGNLKRINLGGSTRLMELPDFSMLTNLEEVDLSYCESLYHIHPSLLSLHSLVTLDLYGCKSLISLESEIHLKSLEFLCFDNCLSLKKFSVSSEEIRELNFVGTSIEILSSAIKQLTKLRHLELSNCKRLESLPELPQFITHLYLSGSNIKCLPGNLKQLTELRSLYLIDCKRLESLPELPQFITHLNLSGSNIKCLPGNIKQLTELRSLHLCDCERLESLPELPQFITHLYLSGSNIKCLPGNIKQLTELHNLHLSDCERLESLPEFPQFIRILDLSRSNIKCLPGNIKQLTELHNLHLSHCKNLESLPELPQFITHLYLSGSNIKWLPGNIRQLTKLRCLYLSDCKRLESLPKLPQFITHLNVSGSNIKCLPGNIKQLTELSNLHLSHCKRLESLPELPQFITHLYLSGSNIKCLPGNIKQLTELSSLNLSDCKRLESLPELPQFITHLYLSGSNIKCLPGNIKQLTELSNLNLSDCKRLESLPELPQFITHLYLSGSNIKCLPGNIKQLTELSNLNLSDCKRLESLPELPQFITHLYLSGSNIKCLPGNIKQLTELSSLYLSD
ncbi:disease resistance protein RPV1-like [Gastrolobium bilobum]|uniref:disease resistance protein RPV1-like n=1 Tax=Gastrolobium bilobum TaxID=150636 RepID=UPI002AB0D356|nr:disease resistance protein RPV1-like [Gastrolobium bilobum]